MDHFYRMPPVHRWTQQPLDTTFEPTASFDIFKKI